MYFLFNNSTFIWSFLGYYKSQCALVLFSRCLAWFLRAVTLFSWWEYFQCILGLSTTTVSPNLSMSLARAGVSGPCLEREEATGRKLFIPNHWFYIDLALKVHCCFSWPSENLALIISHLFELIIQIRSSCVAIKSLLFLTLIYH